VGAKNNMGRAARRGGAVFSCGILRGRPCAKGPRGTTVPQSKTRRGGARIIRRWGGRHRPEKKLHETRERAVLASSGGGPDGRRSLHLLGTAKAAVSFGGRIKSVCLRATSRPPPGGAPGGRTFEGPPKAGAGRPRKKRKTPVRLVPGDDERTFKKTGTHRRAVEPAQRSNYGPQEKGETPKWGAGGLPEKGADAKKRRSVPRPKTGRFSLWGLLKKAGGGGRRIRPKFGFSACGRSKKTNLYRFAEPLWLRKTGAGEGRGGPAFYPGTMAGWGPTAFLRPRRGGPSFGRERGGLRPRVLFPGDGRLRGVFEKTLHGLEGVRRTRAGPASRNHGRAGGTRLSARGPRFLRADRGAGGPFRGTTIPHR